MILTKKWMEMVENVQKKSKKTKKTYVILNILNVLNWSTEIENDKFTRWMRVRLSAELKLNWLIPARHRYDEAHDVRQS